MEIRHQRPKRVSQLGVVMLGVRGIDQRLWRQPVTITEGRNRMVP